MKAFLIITIFFTVLVLSTATPTGLKKSLDIADMLRQVAKSSSGTALKEDQDADYDDTGDALLAKIMASDLLGDDEDVDYYGDGDAAMANIMASALLSGVLDDDEDGDNFLVKMMASDGNEAEVQFFRRLFRGVGNFFKRPKVRGFIRNAGHMIGTHLRNRFCNNQGK